MQPNWNLCCQQLFVGFGLGLVLAIALGCSFPIPSVAQGSANTSDRPETAPVVLDGQTLFSVAAADRLQPQERASVINLMIGIAVSAETSPQLELINVGKTPVIYLNGNQLVSITIQDVKATNTLDVANPDSSLKALADEWLEALEDGVIRAYNERQPDFLRGVLWESGLLLLATICLHGLLGLLWHRYFRKLLQRVTLSDADPNDPLPTEFNLLLNGTLTLGRLLLWGSALLYITNVFPLTRQWGYTVRTVLANTFISRNFSLGDRSFSILDLVILVVLLITLVLLSSAMTNLLRSRLLRLAGINRGSQEAVAILTRYSLISIGTIVILQIWGLDLSSLALLASALGVGIGLGLQNIARDFGSGLVLVFERPIQVGEFVEFGEFMGTVERIGARSTEIRTLDQVSILVPNSRFLDQEVINWSHRNPVSRIRLPVGVAYGSDLEQVRHVLLDAGRQHSNVLSTPPPRVIFTGFGDSTLDFQLMVWVAEPNKQLLIRSDLYFAIEAGLNQHNIEIPFPQQDLHVRSGTLPVELPAELNTLITQWIQNQQRSNETSH